MRSEPLEQQARLLTARALDGSPGAGDLAGKRKGEARSDCWGEGFLNTGVPESYHWSSGGEGERESEGLLGKRLRREERSHLVILGLEAGGALTGENEQYWGEGDTR